jgi:hypothetical protein
MKYYCLFLLALLIGTSCDSPHYFAQQGNYDKAFEGYSSNLRDQSKNKKKEKYLSGLESSYALAQSRDSAELALLVASGKTENWPRINTLHRQIQTRQKTVKALQPLQSRKGYAPQFSMIEAIDSLQDDSRRQAAAYLYEHAQHLLAITHTTGQRQPARDAYYLLRDLKTNYFLYWEHTNALIDSAYHEGKAHILFETSVQKGVSDGSTFWESFSLDPSFVKSEWLIFYKDSTARAQFDYRAKCRLVSLYVGSESNSQTERVETKEVEDGYDIITDSLGKIVSSTIRYRTETTTITTYHSTRSANGSMILDLVDEYTGKVISSEAIPGVYQFDESSETFAPSSPSYWGMIQRVADRVESELRGHLKRGLLQK